MDDGLYIINMIQYKWQKYDYLVRSFLVHMQIRVSEVDVRRSIPVSVNAFKTATNQINFISV